MSFLTAREELVLEIGKNNFAAVLLFKGRGLCISGAFVDPVAVDVFPAAPRSGAAASASLKGREYFMLLPFV